ncbi:MAG: cytochrome c family protein [Roseovarius sp.]
MLDTMTLTKFTGALCGALLVFLLGKWVAEEMYHMGGGHGDDHGQAYIIDTGEDETAEVEDEGPDFAMLMAEADESKGAKVFGKCKACHKLEDGANGVGPHLYGVVGRDVGAVDGYSYSGSLVAVAQTWGVDELNAFLENPKGYAPGTAMAFTGLKKPADRANLIVYLDLTDGDRLPYAAPVEESSAEEVMEETTEEAAAVVEEATEEAAAVVEDVVEEATEMAEEVTEDAAAVVEEAAEEATAMVEGATEEVAAAADSATEEVTAVAEEATEEVAAAAEEAVEEVAQDASGFAAMVAAADPAAGEKVFKKCKACHKIEDGANGVGPHLYGVVDRAVGSVDGFKYSGKLVAVADTWTADNLNEFLTKPRDYAPGTKMAFNGLKKEKDRANVIAYLESISN